MTIKPRKYESLFILRPDVTEADAQKILDRFSAVVTEKGGTVSKAEAWEKRKLAYEINDLKEGQYMIMEFVCDPTVPAEFNRLMRISDDIIRHNLLSIEDAPEVVTA